MRLQKRLAAEVRTYEEDGVTGQNYPVAIVRDVEVEVPQATGNYMGEERIPFESVLQGR